jgi:iron complex transport system substrate-binding protein
VYELGGARHLVGVDTTSTWPEAARRLPKVGYQRALSAEGILSLGPNLVLLSEEAGPPQVIDLLRAAGVKVSIVHGDYSLAGVENKVRAVESALGLAPSGDTLTARLREEFEAAQKLVAHAAGHPRVLFIIGISHGEAMLAGRDTAANSMIDLAGGVNAVTAFHGYRPLTAEAVVSAKPDALLMFTHGLHDLGGKDAVLKLPGISMTPAGQNARVIGMDALYLLGFGPRLGLAVRDLALALHPELATIYSDGHE